MDQSTLERVQATQRAYDRQVSIIRDRVTSAVSQYWGSLRAYRDADITAFVDAVLPVIAAGQSTVSDLTLAYLTHVRATVESTPMALSPVGDMTDLRGVPSAEVYRRPGKTVYSALASGKSLDAAASEGLARAVSLAQTDLQLAKTHTVARSGLRWFRRTLSGAENCALCAIASTQRYYRGDLMPIHPGCDCGVMEVFSERDPGQIIDEDTLEMVHAEVEAFVGVSDRGGRVPDYRNLIVTREHGEYGPTLAWRAQKFTGPTDF